jgi:hypothetical protein
MNNHPGRRATFVGALGNDAVLPRLIAVFSLLSGPLMGMGFDERASEDARARITAFFDKHLRPPAE